MRASWSCRANRYAHACRLGSHLAALRRFSEPEEHPEAMTYSGIMAHESEALLARGEDCGSYRRNVARLLRQNLNNLRPFPAVRQPTNSHVSHRPPQARCLRWAKATLMYSRLPSADTLQTPIASATFPQLSSVCPSSLRRYTVVTASDEWSRNWLTDSIDSPASRRSLAAVWRRMWTPDGRRLPAESALEHRVGRTHGLPTCPSNARSRAMRVISSTLDQSK